MPRALSPDSTPPSSPFGGLSLAPGAWRGPGWSLYPQVRLLRDPTHLRQTPESHLVARRITLTGPRVSSLMAVRPFSPPVHLGPSKESDPTRAWQTCCGIHSTRPAPPPPADSSAPAVPEPRLALLSGGCRAMSHPLQGHNPRTCQDPGGSPPGGGVSHPATPQHPENGCRALATALSQLHR